MKFPNMVYRCPGPHQRPGGTYEYAGVKTQADLDTALAAGWSETLPAAIELADGIKMAVATPPSLQATQDALSNELESLGSDDPEVLGDAPPTRAELEQQAKELDIKFDGRTTDKALLIKINEALI